MSSSGLEHAFDDAVKMVGCFLVIAALLGGVLTIAAQKACATWRVRVEKVQAKP